MRILKPVKMAEGRRHSVEIPLSKTLVALKRVRSLRDPSTNSISKFAIAVDDVDWEANSCARNDACLNFGELEKNHVQPPQKIFLEGSKGDFQKTSANEHSSRIPKNRNATSKKCSIIRVKGPCSKRAALVRQSVQGCCHKPLEHAGFPPSSDRLEEEVDSCSGANVDADDSSNGTIPKKKLGYGGWTISSSLMEDVGMSRVGSPCLSVSEIHTSCSSRGILGLLNTDDADLVESNYSGCGIGYCWSRTPKYKDTTISSEFECQEQPLLSAGGDRSGKDIASFPKSSMSSSQKFRPKSFNELVGLNVITKSLMNAILRGNVASLYLFHGPRGTGKTSTARVFAAALNCLSLEERRPCGFCRECAFFFSGQSRNVKELYAVKLNHRDGVKVLLKNASLSPAASHFKVYIIEECHLLRREILSGILNNIEEHLRRVVFVLITSSHEKLPHSLISQCQSYHFPKVKEDDIFRKLHRICVEEGFVFEKEALSFISSKANGSLQDAETLLDQLALLGKNITLSVTHELIGVVSDDELLDLLDLALSEDTSNTVRRARDLMRSRIDPMQLVLQLANLIMDILSGKCQPEFSEAWRKFFRKHALSESGMRKLKHALRILSDTEKQLRTSKNQATWVTVALLQFNTRGSSVTDQQVLVSNPAASLQNFVCYGCNKLNCSGRHCNRAKLETIWSRTIAAVESGTLRSFLQKEGNLSAVHLCEGQAIVTIEFYNLDHVIRAEKSWRSIASSFMNVLGCSIEIRIKLLSKQYKKNSKLRKFSFGFLSCSGRKQDMYDSNVGDGDNTDEPQNKEAVDANLVPEMGYFHDKEIISLSRVDATAQHNVLKSPFHFAPAAKFCNSVLSSSKDGEELCDACNEETVVPSSCFARIFEFHKRILSSGASHAICLNVHRPGKTEFSKAVDKTYFLGYEPHEQTPASNALITYSSGKSEMPVKCSRSSSRLLCWRASASSP